MICGVIGNELKTVAFFLFTGNVEDCTEAVQLLKDRSCLKDCNPFSNNVYGAKEIPRVETRHDKRNDSFFTFIGEWIQMELLLHQHSQAVDSFS